MRNSWRGLVLFAVLLAQSFGTPISSQQLNSADTTHSQVLLHQGQDDDRVGVIKVQSAISVLKDMLHHFKKIFE
jgi:hypothetical protein